MSQAIATSSQVLVRNTITNLVIQESAAAGYELGVSVDYVADMAIQHQLSQEDVVVVLDLRKEYQAALGHINILLNSGADLEHISAAYRTREMLESSLQSERERMAERLPDGTRVFNNVPINDILDFLECFPEAMDQESDAWSVIDEAIEGVCAALEFIHSPGLAIKTLCSVARTYEVKCVDTALAIITRRLERFTEEPKE